MKTPKILLVLADIQVLNTYGTYLRERGYEIVMCASPGEGINSLAACQVSLVIVGQETPAFEGRQVLEYSVRTHPEIPVLVIARVVDVRCYLAAMELGATDYLEEPEPWDLAWVVETQLLRSEMGRLPEASATNSPMGNTLAPSPGGVYGRLLEGAAATGAGGHRFTRR